MTIALRLYALVVVPGMAFWALRSSDPDAGVVLGAAAISGFFAIGVSRRWQRAHDRVSDYPSKGIDNGTILPVPGTDPLAPLFMQNEPLFSSQLELGPDVHERTMEPSGSHTERWAPSSDE